MRGHPHLVRSSDTASVYWPCTPSKILTLSKPQGTVWGSMRCSDALGPLHGFPAAPLPRSFLACHTLVANSAILREVGEAQAS